MANLTKIHKYLRGQRAAIGDDGVCWFDFMWSPPRVGRKVQSRRSSLGIPHVQEQPAFNVCSDLLRAVRCSRSRVTTCFLRFATSSSPSSSANKWPLAQQRSRLFSPDLNSCVCCVRGRTLDPKRMDGSTHTKAVRGENEWAWWAVELENWERQFEFVKINGCVCVLGVKNLWVRFLVGYFLGKFFV